MVNINGGEDNNSRLSFTPTESNTYCIAAGAYGYRTGTYELSVDEVM
jgi:hypothetical protein